MTYSKAAIIRELVAKFEGFLSLQIKRPMA